jgi:heterodisulfide reductase subunit C2
MLLPGCHAWYGAPAPELGFFPTAGILRRGGVLILSRLKTEDDVVAQINAISGVDVRACYQCGKCTAGCPLTSAMDLMPNQILRLLQLGEYEQVLKSAAIWQCASCLTCAARCPKDVDPARVMDALRTILVRQGVAHVEIPKIPADLLAETPQQGLIGGFRKYVGY